MKCKPVDGTPRKLVCTVDREYRYIVAFIKRRKTNEISLEYRFRNREEKKYETKTFYLGELPQDWILPVRDAELAEEDKNGLTPEHSKKLLLAWLRKIRKKASEKELRKQIKDLAIAIGKERGIDVKSMLREKNKERKWNKDMLKEFAPT